MAFGINKLAKILSLQMFFLQIKKFLDSRRYRENKLILSIGCNIHKTKFGINNFLGENVSLVNSSIGDYSYISANTKIKNTTIGNFCSIGPNVQMTLGIHPSDFISTHPTFYANNKPFATFADKTYIEEYKNVKIGHDVWIGEGVLIPGGVTIGNGAIINARSVVTKNVEPYSIVGGIPAKHIKYRFEKEVIEKINQSEWWNWDETKLKNNIELFRDTKAFVNKLAD